jgi:hypothetical protein
LGGLCGLIAFIVAPGHIRHAGGEPFVRFGELDNRTSPRAERLRQAFVRAGVQVDIPSNIQAALWMKLLFITPWSRPGRCMRRCLPEGRRPYNGMCWRGVPRSWRPRSGWWCVSAARVLYRRPSIRFSTVACCPLNPARVGRSRSRSEERGTKTSGPMATHYHLSLYPASPV